MRNYFQIIHESDNDVFKQRISFCVYVFHPVLIADDRFAIHAFGDFIFLRLTQSCCSRKDAELSQSAAIQLSLEEKALIKGSIGPAAGDLVTDKIMV